jgi:hypothetical protein
LDAKIPTLEHKHHTPKLCDKFFISVFDIFIKLKLKKFGGLNDRMAGML